ncbi:hypothetical protein [Streptomyces sp. CMSTAAHL-2]|uniref:hypothetical protein n=1 Tax=Streptomyces sp. CMSTAAHL-2 TaxID=2904522 RepID=UPI001E4E73E9|nr:hypothetical protein [Streptomyces sp. CMSTAAHL-2]MCE3034968.1 hypothetical protein [Streptomyces sp. CMSTAAHL-2]
MATLASGLAPFARRFFPAVGMTLFIVLSIATSGGAAPAAMLPTFFQYVHAVIPLGDAVEAALRSALCFGGAGMLRPVLVLCAWIAAGIALLGLDAQRHRHAARTGGRCRAPVTVLDPGGRQLVSTLTNAYGEYAAARPYGRTSCCGTVRTRAERGSRPRPRLAGDPLHAGVEPLEVAGEVLHVLG